MYEWLGSRGLFVAGSTMANQQIALRHFEDFMDDRLDWFLGELKPLHIRDYASG